MIKYLLIILMLMVGCQNVDTTDKEVDKSKSMEIFVFKDHVEIRCGLIVLKSKNVTIITEEVKDVQRTP